MEIALIVSPAYPLLPFFLSFFLISSFRRRMFVFKPSFQVIFVLFHAFICTALTSSRSGLQAHCSSSVSIRLLVLPIKRNSHSIPNASVSLRAQTYTRSSLSMLFSVYRFVRLHGWAWIRFTLFNLTLASLSRFWVTLIPSLYKLRGDFLHIRCAYTIAFFHFQTCVNWS